MTGSAVLATKSVVQKNDAQDSKGIINTQPCVGMFELHQMLTFCSLKRSHPDLIEADRL